MVFAKSFHIYNSSKQEMEKRICFLFFEKKANDFMILNIFLNSCFLFSLFIEEKSFCICLFFLFLFSFFVQFHRKET
jgi:hypothetical protein